MAFSTQSNLYSSPSTYWMNSGIPFIIPSVGSSGMWDGSKWIRSNDTQTQNTVQPFYFLNSNSSINSGPQSSQGISPSTNSVNGFGLGTPGFGGAFNDEALASMGQQGALSGMANSAMASVGNAALTGSIAGGITGSLSNGISTAVAGLANPGSIAGVIGGALNGALGFNTSPAMGALAGLASLASPALGLAVGVFGPSIADLAMDALDARSNEFSRDYVEDLANSYVGGRVASAHMNNALNNTLDFSQMGLMDTVSQALGQLGVTNMGTIQGALEAAYSDKGYTEDVAHASAMADVVGKGISEITSDYGVGFGSQQAGAGLGMGNTLGDFGWGGVVDAALGGTLDSLGLGVGFGQVDTTTQSPSPASASIGQGVGEQADAAGKGGTPGAAAGAPSSNTSDAANAAATTDAQEGQDDNSSDASTDGGGDGGGDGSTDGGTSGDGVGSDSGTDGGSDSGDGSASDGGSDSGGNDD